VLKRAAFAIAWLLVPAPALAQEAETEVGPTVVPFAAIVGGLEYERLDTRDMDTREDRGVTIALSRFGLRAVLGHGVSAESEFEANAGPHGTSAWEGQAALSVRNQLVRLERAGWRVDAGRITDPASLDFTSVHVADMLLTDSYTRNPLLASGFNRGNGVLVRRQLPRGFTAGFALNASNPTSTTASLVVGGTFPPFSRFYFAPYEYVGRDAAKLPADEYYIVVGTPSAEWLSERVQVKVAAQIFQVNTNTSRADDQKIDGYNVRGSVAVIAGRVRPFANASLVQNEVVDPDDGTRLSGEIFTGTTVSLGCDVDVRGRHGVGGQVAVLRDQQGMGTQATQVYANLGGTYWVGDTTAVAVRAAYWSRCEELDGAPCDREGERSLFTTLRTAF
jgi:hypothetical protein